MLEAQARKKEQMTTRHKVGERKQQIIVDENNRRKVESDSDNDSTNAKEILNWIEFRNNKQVSISKKVYKNDP
jgi:hypothetical protein